MKLLPQFNIDDHLTDLNETRDSRYAFILGKLLVLESWYDFSGKQLHTVSIYDAPDMHNPEDDGEWVRREQEAVVWGTEDLEEAETYFVGYIAGLFKESHL